jgi:hypothetical protein
MKACEITEPGLYWAICKGASLPVSVEDPDPGSGRLYLCWPGMDDELLATAWETSPPLQRYDFIGPFPRPGQGPLFPGFKAALEALCRAYGVTLATSGHDGLDVWKADAGRDEPLHCAGFKDRTGG